MRNADVDAVAAEDRPIDLTYLLFPSGETENLRSLVPQLWQIAGELGVKAELLVVDTSTDDTVGGLDALGCKVRRLAPGGYGRAFREGLAASRGAFVLTMDADHSHHPRFIRHMWALRDRADVVIGSRYAPGGRAEMPWLRRVSSRLLNWSLARLLDLPLSDLSSGYRLYRREAVESLLPLVSDDFDLLEEVLVKAWCSGYRVREVPIDYRPRSRSRSSARALRVARSHVSTAARIWTLRNSATTCDYDARAFSSWIPLQRWWQRRRFALVNEMLSETGLTLDIGCGASQIIRSRPGAVGVDLNAAKLRFLRGSNPLLVRASAFHLPFRGSAFAATVCSEVIEHVAKSDELFREMNRVLQPGGALVLGTPDYSTRAWRFVEYWYQKLLPNAYADEHISHYTRAELLELLPRFGFEVLACRFVFGAELIVLARKVAAPRA
jgi:dolichol-phosphate mannosyltransferase